MDTQREIEGRLYYAMLDSIWAYVSEVSGTSFGNNFEVAEYTYNQIIEEVEGVLADSGVS